MNAAGKVECQLGDVSRGLLGLTGLLLCAEPDSRTWIGEQALELASSPIEPDRSYTREAELMEGLGARGPLVSLAPHFH